MGTAAVCEVKRLYIAEAIFYKKHHEPVIVKASRTLILTRTIEINYSGSKGVNILWESQTP